MDYAALIRDAWRLTWRYRFLWVLGLFAGGTIGFSGSGTSGWRQPQPAPPMAQANAEAVARSVTTWVQANLGLVAGLAAAVVVLGLAVLVVSLIAQGAMARATADLARGQASSLGLAWRAGVHTFWRYLGLWLLLIGIGMGVALVLGAGVALVIGLAALSMAAAVGVGLVLFLPLTLLVIGLGVAGSIVIAYAQRAIAVENVGPGTALRAGWRLLRAHPGASLLVGLLNLALSLAAGLLGMLALLVVLMPLGAIGAVTWAVAGLGAVTIGYLALAGLVLLAALLVLVAIGNTFFWNFWTLTYLRLSGSSRPTTVAA